MPELRLPCFTPTRDPSHSSRTSSATPVDPRQAGGHPERHRTQQPRLRRRLQASGDWTAARAGGPHPPRRQGRRHRPHPPPAHRLAHRRHSKYERQRPRHRNPLPQPPRRRHRGAGRQALEALKRGDAPPRQPPLLRGELYESHHAKSDLYHQIKISALAPNSRTSPGSTTRLGRRLPALHRFRPRPTPSKTPSPPASTLARWKAAVIPAPPPPAQAGIHSPPEGEMSRSDRESSFLRKQEPRSLAGAMGTRCPKRRERPRLVVESVI